MSSSKHSHHSPPSASNANGGPERSDAVASRSGFWGSKAGLVTIGFLLIAAFFLLSEHWAHALGVLPYLIILACPLLHLFMHGGHGGHGSGHGGGHGHNGGGHGHQGGGHGSHGGGGGRH